MASVILTHALLVLCGAIFVRLFTFRRGALRFSRLKSCGAWLVMTCAGVAVIHILRGDLVLQPAAWPLVVLVAVFAWAIWRAGGNLAGVLRPEEPVWSGTERRRGGGQ